MEEGKWRKTEDEGPGGFSSTANKVKVIDMTGKEQRVLSGYHAIAAQQVLKSSSKIRYFLPNALVMRVHNLKLLLQMPDDYDETSKEQQDKNLAQV